MIMPSHFHTLLVASVLLTSIATLGVATFTQKPTNTEFSLMESGRARNISPAPAAPAEVKLVSYNIRWRSGDQLREMIELLKHDPEIGKAQIIGLQEVDRDKKRTETQTRQG